MNKSYLRFLVFLYFFIFKNFLEEHITILGYFDELIAIAAIPIIILSEGNIVKNHCFRFCYPICGYILIGIMSSLFYHYQPALSCALPDLFLNVKFWLSIITGYYMFRNLSLEEYAKGIYFHVRLITWLYICLIAWDHLTGSFNSPIRYGLRSTQLFYTHPTFFSANCVLLIGVLLSIRDYIKESDKYFVLLLILMCTTLRSKAFGAAAVFAVLYYITYVQKRKIGISTFFLLTPMIAAVAWEQIYYYFFSSIQSNSARYQLLAKSIPIAKDHFPLGAGFGTYGSHFSSVFYSPLYKMYGLSSIHGLSYGSSNFVSDSFWPMILGELGWVGLLLFVSAIGVLFEEIQEIRKMSISCNLAGICMLIYLLISSSAESAFVNPIAIPLAVWLGCLFVQENAGKEYAY